MTRHVFYSFDYENDVLRASQVRQIGSITPAGRLAYGNDWETVKRKDDATIKRWINQQMHGVSAVVVLIGEKTSESSWVKYEIEQGWKKGKGVLGIHIHNLQCPHNGFSPKGKSPFDGVIVSGYNLLDKLFPSALPRVPKTPFDVEPEGGVLASALAALEPGPKFPGLLPRVPKTPFDEEPQVRHSAALAALDPDSKPGLNLGSVVKVYDPQEDFLLGKTAYHDISNNIEKWIEEAILIRKRYV